MTWWKDAVSERTEVQTQIPRGGAPTAEHFDHLAVDSTQRYKFPYGDFTKVHRCAVLSAESRAGQYRYADIEDAAARLHRMMDPKAHRASRK
jgi:hypothetical protein